MHSQTGITPFHPIIEQWFKVKFGEPTDVQRQAWPLIAQGDHTLIAAPTGSGKTLSALLPILNGIAEEKAANAEEGKRGVQALYVTPLKALNNDIYQHVFGFLEELRQLADDCGIDWPGITVGVRTGDTAQSTRASMLRRPPDVLVTTPESLYILLTSVKAKEMLKRVRHVVVDEIHDLAGSDRGTHLSLTLERLSVLIGQSPQRIGVSATQKPLTRIGRFLGGLEDAPGGGVRPRLVSIVESTMDRPIELEVTVPSYGILRHNKKEDIWTPLIEELLRHIADHRTTIIYVSNRRLCERLSARLNEAVGEGFCRSHHGSVSRERRLETERMLRSGELRCLVATSSLELGIDVGYIDLVLQIDTPFTAASGIQRMGRSGHAVGGISRGAILVRSRGLLPEVAVLAERIVRKDTEEIEVPRHTLGVLAQQIVAAVAADDWQPNELYQLIQRSDAYEGYPYERFIELLEMLSGFYPFIRPLITWDRIQDRLTRRAGTAMSAVMGAGTIPQSTGFPVYHAEHRIHLGELDEEFICESRIGDTFQLGATAWRIRSIKPDRIEVSESASAIGEIPFWRAEGQGRSYELSVAVGELMIRLEELLLQSPDGEGDRAAIELLMEQHHFTAAAADSLIGLLRAQRAVSAWPTHKRIVIEWYTDESGLHHIVIHSWFGRRFNRTWLMALQTHLEQVYPHEFESTAKDNGIELVFRYFDPAVMELLQGVNSDTLEPLLLDEVPSSPLFAAVFRQSAETALLLSRSFRRTPAWLKRLRGQELLRDVMPAAAKFPLVKEALRICMEQALDVPRVRAVLKSIEEGSIERLVIRSTAASPLAAQFFYEFLNTAIYESDALTRDLRYRMQSISRELAAEVFGEDETGGLFDDALLTEEKLRLSGAGFPLSSREDLFRLLKEHGDQDEQQWSRILAREEEAARWSAELLSRGEIVLMNVHGDLRYVCSDESAMFRELSTSAEAQGFVLNRYIEHVVAFSAADLCRRYPISLDTAEAWVASWQAEGRIMASPLGKHGGQGEQWTSVRIAQRLTRAARRRASSGQVDLARYSLLLLTRQHITPEHQLSGTEGVREVLSRLQGLYLPLSWWESFILPVRVKDYRREDLDLLCASGDMLWLGKKEEGAREGKVAFFRQDAPELYLPCLQHDAEPLHPELYRLLRDKGARFLTQLSHETGEAPTALMTKLLDLVWQGLVANDQFAPVRLHGQKITAADRSKFRSGLGRWYAVVDLQEGSVSARAGLSDSDQYEFSVLSWTRHLLQRNGILTRAIVQEQSPFDWDTHAAALTRMEDLGIVTRGLLVREVNALQYAEKQTAAALQQAPPAPRTAEAGAEEEEALLCAADPANPFGIVADWPDPKSGAAFGRKPGNYLLMMNGRWELWVENRGKKIRTIGKDNPDPVQAARQIRRIARTLIRVHGMRKLVIESWNGSPIGDTEVGEQLRKLGAERDQSAYVIWPSML